MEERLTLSTTAVGDAQFALYDNGVVSTLDPGFSRGVETVNGMGDPVSADARRYGEPVAYSPTVDWDPVEVDFLPFDRDDIRVQILATGWDHDGVTPLMLLKTSGFRTELLFVRGEDFELVNTISYRGYDLMQGAVEDRRYLPEAAIIHHGLVVFAVQRSEPEGAGYTPTGVDFITTQDYGNTLDRVPVVGGGLETPSLPGDVSRGMVRVEEWSFSNPFPVAGIDDTESAWFPWADYINKLGSPKGGQIGLFRADRDPQTGVWELSPNRVIYNHWVPEDSGGFHSHAAAITEGGVVSHWGDVGYRNVTRFHAFDLADYQNAPVTTVDVYGGYQATPELHRLAPQPAATAPSPVYGEHFATGDLTPDNLLSFGSLQTTGDELAVRSERYNPERGITGGVHMGVEVLHIHWLQGVGYVVGSRGAPIFYFSHDGVYWSEIVSRDAETCTLWLYGERLIASRSKELFAATLPTVETVRPLQVAPGGVNQLDPTPDWLRGPGEGDTARQVVFSDGLWRYADTLLPLDVQPPQPPFTLSAPVYEVTIGSNAEDLGVLWLQDEGESSDSRRQHLTQLWLANLSDQGILFGAGHGARDFETGVSGFSDTFHFGVSDTQDWFAVGASSRSRASAVDGVGRFALNLASHVSSPGSRFLVAVAHFEATDSPTYPLDPGASGPDEIERIDGLSLDTEWSLGLVAHWPEDMPLRIKNRMPIASLTGASGDAVELAIEHLDFRSRLVVTLIHEGVQVEQETVPLVGRHFVDRNDFLDIAVSKDRETLRLSFSVSGERLLRSEIDAAWDLDLDAFNWADRNGDVVAAVNPVLVTLDHESWDVDQHEEWLQGSLSEKAVFLSRPETGDFNADGSVDAADYSVWRDTLYDNTPGRRGDMNSDGDIDELDAAVWRAQYGVTGVGWTADLNDDSVVDAADYTIWRDLAAPQLRPGSGADADGNGYVQQEDYLLWRDAYGTQYPTLEGLRTQAAAESPMLPLEFSDQEPAKPIAASLASTPAMISPATFPATASVLTGVSSTQGDSEDLLLYWRQVPTSETSDADDDRIFSDHEALDTALAQQDHPMQVMDPLPALHPYSVS